MSHQQDMRERRIFLGVLIGIGVYINMIIATYVVASKSCRLATCSFESFLCGLVWPLYWLTQFWKMVLT